MTEAFRLIVIGNGMAGAAVIEEIVKRPSQPRLTVFGGEPQVGYNRILLSEVLGCAKTFDEIYLYNRRWYEDHGVQLQTGVFATGIDTDRREVITQDGGSHRYDKLLIAVGSVPFIPAMKGSDRKGVFTFRNIEDTESMIRWAADHYRAVVIGGGLLGLEAARGLTNRGMAVTVVHLMNHLMEQQLDEKAGAILKAEIEKMGIAVRLGCTVEEILGDRNVEAVRLTTGDRIEADLVLVTAGIRPNVKLAQAAGLAVNRGIEVDDSMQTSRPGVYAVGECIEHRGKTYGLVAPILEQAKVAADAIAGEGKRVYIGSVPSTTLKVAGIQLISMGDFAGRESESEELVYMDAGAATYKKLVIRNNRVAGAIFLGDDGGSREVREMIQNSRDISAVRSRLLTGTGASEKSGDPAALPDTTLVCNCHSVTKAEIVGAIREKNCKTRDSVAECTKASTGCGSCATLVEQILENVLEESSAGAGPAARKTGTSGGGINKVEGWKKEKDGLDVLDDLHRYAREGWETISEGDVQRLKWYGLFLRTPTPGLFMIRVRIPNGIARAEQFRAFAEISERFGKGLADLTTRQQIQLRDMRIENVPGIFEWLRSVGLTSLQTGMDNVRNIMGCSVTGLSPTESIDTATIVRQFNDLLVGNRDYTNLPRKFNIAVTGCRENCLPVESQDLALIPATREIDGKTIPGFNLLVGGKIGSGGFRAAGPLDVFAPPEEAVEIMSQITRIYRDHGPRENRTKARLAFLVEEWGVGRLRKELESRLGRPLSRAGKDERDPKKKTDHIGVYRQKQAGLNYIGLAVPVGRMTTRQMIEAARLSEEYGTGEIRLTGGQNLILPNIPDRVLGKLLQEEPLLKELRYNPSEIMRGLVSCTGIEYCGMAVIETKNRALGIAREMEREIATAKPVGVHWSGCPAGCGNHLVSEIGLLGKRAKVAKDDGTTRVVDAVDIFLGGRGGVRPQAGVKVLEDVPCDQLPQILKGLVRYVARDKAVEARKGEMVSLTAFANLKVSEPVTETLSKETTT
ncbi:MAG TPA: FAD-dependent oxidoreductase [Nitrospiria bacterium]|nr:FAD-dependent oxidoreductase [Nitrospiria bacterium]